MKNYYGLLGIDTSATRAEIKKNYRLLAVKFHPDKNSDPDAPAKFIEITEAYHVLSEKKSRAKYDLARWQILKQKEEAKNSDYDFRAFVPPKVSLRTRRNKAQRIRGAAYQKVSSELKKLLHLAIESLRIVSRHLLHVLGIILFAVILNSILTQAPASFEKGTVVGIFSCVIAVAVAYVIFKIGQSSYRDFKKDIQAFSVFFGLSYTRATILILLALGLLLCVLIAIIVVRSRT